MNYLVTGGAGFIGSHITDTLLAQGHKVIVVDNLLLGKKEFVQPQVQFEQVDICDFDTLRSLMNGIDGVFHVAADPRLPISIENPRATHESNVNGTLNVLVAAKEAGVKKVVFSSTCAMYEDNQPLPLNELSRVNPESPYGLHKKIGEDYLRLFAKLYGLKTISLRYFNVYGPRKTADGGYPMVIPIFLKQRAQGVPMTIVGDGKQTRDYVHVRDVVQANILAMNSDIGDGRVFNIGSGRQISVNEIAEMIGGEKVYLPQRPGEMRFIQCDAAAAKAAFGWESTVVFEEGLEELKNQAS